MEDWQQRVVTECAELVERLNTLTEFLKSPEGRALEGEDRRLLHEQWKHMCRYRAVLGARIKRFEGSGS